MATRTRSKRAQSIPTEEDHAPRPTKRGRNQARAQKISEEQGESSTGQRERDDNDEDSGRQEALRFAEQPSGESSDQAAEQRDEYIERCLPELASQAEDLIGFFLQSDEERQKAWNRHLFSVKGRYFQELRQPFEEPQGFPFIGAVIEFSDDDGDDVVKVGYVNLATSLVMIDQIASGEEPSTLEYLTQIDDFLYKLYDAFNYDTDLELILNIRSLLFVKTLEEETDTSRSPPKMAKVQELLASCFCRLSEVDGKPNYPHLLINGPFKNMAHEADEEMDDMCEARIARIVEIWKKAGKGAVLAKLQEEFPFSEKLGELRQNIIAVYQSVKMKSKAAPQTQEQFHDAREDIDDLESVADSQPIVRASTQGVSFFTGPDALRALSHVVAPSSNQQVPAEDSNSAILGPRPDSVAPSTLTGTNRSAVDIPRRQRTTATNESEQAGEGGDEEDAFEEDNRPVDKEKSAAVNKVLNSRPPPAAPSTTMPPPPRPSALPSSPQQQQQQPLSSPPSSAFEAMRAEKHRLSALARLPPPSSSTSAGPQPLKQRQQWSDNDQFLLIDLVARCHGSWSRIDKEHGRRFEYPRNQQAYRDKARNLKVDFLMTDKVLPPCFDLVTLGPKEVQKLSSFGKNPYRKEKDLDDDGTPINTEMLRE